MIIDVSLSNLDIIITFLNNENQFFTDRQIDKMIKCARHEIRRRS